VTPGAVTFSPATRPLRGELSVPSDKSITHRALMIAAVCRGPVRILRPLWAGDTRSTARCLRSLGVRIEPADVGSDAAGDILVQGVGLDGLVAPQDTLDAGNSGTTMRLLAGLVAGVPGEIVIDGDESLRQRPMRRIMEPLRQMGVAAEAEDGRHPPVTVRGGRVRAVRYQLPVASAQVKSCVLLAGLHADGITEVVEPTPSRDHTERLLQLAGADVHTSDGVIALRGRPELALDAVGVPGDASSAAFLAAAAAVLEGSSLVVRGVGLNPTRMGFYEVLRRMGACVDWEVAAGEGEPQGTLRVGQAPLRGVRVSAKDVPLLIDEVPLLALVATAADDHTVIEGLAELRVKESDRLTAVADIITDLGGRIDVAGDALHVHPGRPIGGVVDSRGDHRLAMLGAIAGLMSRDGATVERFEAAEISFPGFERVLEEVLS